MLHLEPSILETGLVGANTLHHEMLVFFRETLRSHGRVGQPPEDEHAPQDL